MGGPKGRGGIQKVEAIEILLPACWPHFGKGEVVEKPLYHAGKSVGRGEELVYERASVEGLGSIDGAVKSAGVLPTSGKKGRGCGHMNNAAVVGPSEGRGAATTTK